MVSEQASSPVHRRTHRTDQSHAVRIEHLFLKIHLFHLPRFEVLPRNLALLFGKLLADFHLLVLLIGLLAAYIHTFSIEWIRHPIVKPSGLADIVLDLERNQRRHLL